MPQLLRTSRSSAVLPLLLGPTRISVLTRADLRREVRRLCSVSRSKKLGPCRQWTTSKTLAPPLEHMDVSCEWTPVHAQPVAAGLSGLHCKTVERASVLRGMQTKPQLPVETDTPNRHDVRACPAAW